MLMKATTYDTAPAPLLLAVERAAGGCLATAPQGLTAVNHVGSSLLR